MNTSTHAARYAADHIETGESDEACAECDGEAERIDATGRVHSCRACGGRGLVAASARVCERYSDDSEVHGTARECGTCDGKGTVPHWAALMLAKRAA